VPTIQVRTLQRAADLVGGEEELAHRLEVVPSHLALWISETVSPPDDVFLKAADIVTGHSLRQLATISKKPPDASEHYVSTHRGETRMPQPLRPCPFCAAPMLTFVQLDDNLWAVTCESCEAIGPHPRAEQDEAAAVKRWNDRPG